MELQTFSHGDNADGKLTVYYDGSCPLCTAEIKYYSSRIGGRKLCLVDVSAENAQLSSDLTLEDAMSRFHVRKSDGTLVSGPQAFAEIWRVVPSWAWASRLVGIPGAPAVLEILYRSFLVIRPWLSLLAARLGVQAANPRKN